MRKSVSSLSLAILALAACKSDSNDPGAGAPAALLVLAGGTTQTGIFSQPIAIAPTVLVTDASNRPVPGVQITFALGAGAGTLSATTQSTGATGTASVVWTMGTTFGAKTLTATAPGLSPVVFNAKVIAPPAGVLAFNFTDPAGDTLFSSGSTKAIDLLSFRGDFKSDSLIVTATFAAPVVIASDAANGLGGWFEFDIDDSVQTGFTPFANDYGGTANVGIEYSLNLFGAAPGRFDLNSATAAPAPIFASVIGNTVIMHIPMSALGNDDGNFSIAAVVGNRERPTDLFPNVGHTTVRRDFGIAATGNVPIDAGQIAARRGAIPRRWRGRTGIR